MPEPTPILSLRRVTKRFGPTVALDDVSLDLRPGEVHALLGENGAGKSTLINVLSGELTPDSGEILLKSEPVRFRGPWEATARGISVVHQELAICPNLTVAQNLALPRAALAPLWTAVKDPEPFARSLLEGLGAGHVDVRANVRDLGVGRQQTVEIAKALALQAAVLVLDEPNSALTAEESAFLFRAVRQLRDAGVSVLYVSHRLEEVMAIADRVTIMRDGRVVDTGPAASFGIPDLIRKMVGREVNHLFRREPLAPPREAVALQVRGHTDPQRLRPVAFRVRQGEIYGLAGLPGSGKDEVMECLAGLRPFAGEFRLDGTPLHLRSPIDAIRNGVAIVPADRRDAGIFPVLDILSNVASANLRAVSRAGILHRGALGRLAAGALARMNLRARSLRQKAGTLSGGNQQKVVLARGVASAPKVLLVHEPTRGIDVGAKAEIYGILNGLAAHGLAVVIASAELPELMGQCDRIAVFHGGALVREFAKDAFDEEEILAWAMGHGRSEPTAKVTR